MSKPTDLRVVKTRQTIRNALISLMSEKELQDITISELSARAQINRKTFYRHYRAISDVVTEFEDELLSDFSDILKSSKTSIFDIGAVLKEISALISGNQDYFQKLLKLNPELFSGGRIKAMLRRSLEVALRDVCRISDEQTLHALSEFTISGFLALYSSWFDGGCRESLDALTEISRKMISDGLKGFVPDDKLREIIS
ncbi:MAG: TetR/AcrR family transcriptional regulator [Oscillospiraceae bacterium]|nr:TetR/AcrR family transcriptional regulator [Oscillospiraceae bacterium]